MFEVIYEQESMHAYFVFYIYRGSSIFSQDKKKKYEPPIPTRVGKKKKKLKGPEAANKLPQGLFVVLCVPF